MNMHKILSPMCRRGDRNYGKTINWEIETGQKFVTLGFFCIIDLYDKWKY